MTRSLALSRPLAKLLLAAAPAALAAAYWLLPAVDPTARLGAALDREGALEAARSHAREAGFEVEGWIEVLHLEDEGGDRLARYLRLKQTEAPREVDAVRRLSPPLAARAVFSSPEDAATAESGTVEVLLSLDGRPLGIEAKVRAAPPAEEELAAQELSGVERPGPEEVAEAALRTRLGNALYEELGLSATNAQSEDDGEAEVGEAGEGNEDAESGGDDELRVNFTTNESAPMRLDLGSEEGGAEDQPAEADSPSGEALSESSQSERSLSRRFLWKRSFEALPELELELRLRVRDGRVIEESITTELEGDLVAERLERGGGTAIYVLGWVLQAAALVFFFLYGLWRYVERFRESEVSHGRTVLIGAIVGLLACLVTHAMISEAGPVDAGLDSPMELAILLVVIFVTFLFVGLFLGVVWAGSEGDVREIYGPKLVSLDALLAGRWLSANVGRAVAVGIACAAWAVLARTLALLPWSGVPEAGPELRGAAFVVLHPWHQSLARAFAFLLPFLPMGLLVPLSLQRRWTRSRLRTLPMLIALGWLASFLNPFTSASFPTLASLAEAAVWGAALLGPFVAFDLVAGVVSYTVALALLQALYFLHQPAGSLRLEGAVALGVLAVFASGTAFLGRRGAELEEEEVRPGYARNMLERAALTAELSAARQAQNRMLPATAPEAPGVAISVCCPPEWEGEGDYFDFFPLPGERLGLAMASFGRQGLAAALRMTLAKGFLLSYSWRDLPAEEALGRLNQRLGELVEEGDEVLTSYGVFDPAARRLRLAWGRPAPLVVRLPAAGGAPQVLAGGAEQADPAGSGEGPAGTLVRDLDLEVGDRLIFAHVEGIDWQASRHRGRSRLLDTLEKTSAESAEELLRTVKRKGLRVGTVVLLRVTDVEAVGSQGEEAA